MSYMSIYLLFQQIAAVCHEAALKALEEDISTTNILQKHFLLGLEAVKPRLSHEMITFYENYKSSRNSKSTIIKA